MTMIEYTTNITKCWRYPKKGFSNHGNKRGTFLRRIFLFQKKSRQVFSVWIVSYYFKKLSQSYVYQHWVFLFLNSKHAEVCRGLKNKFNCTSLTTWLNWLILWAVFVKSWMQLFYASMKNLITFDLSHIIIRYCNCCFWRVLTEFSFSLPYVKWFSSLWSSEVAFQRCY